MVGLVSQSTEDQRQAHDDALFYQDVRRRLHLFVEREAPEHLANVEEGLLLSGDGRPSLVSLMDSLIKLPDQVRLIQSYTL